MNKHLVSLIFTETDPYFIREILALFTSYFVITSFFSPFNSNLGREGIFLNSTSGNMFLFPLVYSVVIAGLFARSLERGSFGFLLTMPINRSTVIPYYILVSVITEVGVFSIPIVFADYLAFSTLTLDPLAFVIMSVFVFSFLYISTGYLLAAVSRSSILSMMMTLGIFLILNIYSTTIFPRSVTGQFLLSGISSLSIHSSIPAGLGYILVFVTILGALFTILAHFTLRIKGVKSGR